MTEGKTTGTGEARLTEATRFWRHLFGGQRGLLHVFTGERDAVGEIQKGTISSRNFRYPDAAESAATWALEKSDEGREVYFCAHLLTDHRRLKANAAPVRALWGDLDGAEIPNGELKPTAVIESSPGRFHAYWRLSREIAPEQAEDLNRRIALRIGADPSGFDLTQLLRVPGTANRKYPDVPEVTLTGLAGNQSYDAAELERRLPREPHDGFRKPQSAGEEILNGSRNKQLTSIAGTLRRRGLDRDAIYHALLGINETACKPPLSEAEVSAIAASVARYEPGSAKNGRHEAGPSPEEGRTARGEGTDRRADLRPRFFTDAGLAEMFIRHHGAGLRFCYPWGRWLFYDEKRWVVDDCGRIEALAKETVRGMYHAADPGDGGPIDKDLVAFALRCQSRSRIESMIALARSEPGVPISPDELDAYPWLLNVLNGTVDLRTGKLREHCRENLLTKITGAPYHPDATAPTWEAFLERVLPSPAVRRFVQKAVGYSITGDVSERVLLLLHGMGRNGKSTFLEALRELLGAEDGYAMKTPAETLMAKPAGGVPNDVARLKGARFVSASETEKERRLAEALVKELTGGDTISARFMRAEWFDFRPTHKFWLATNHKPEIRGTDPAIWDRIRLVGVIA